MIGKEVFRQFKAAEPNTVLLDGDEMRRIFHHDHIETDYTVEGRRENARRITEICLWLDQNNINVVACVLSLFHDTQDWNREHYKRYFEVFIDVPMEILAERDIKDLYKPAMDGSIRNVVGVDIPFLPPKAPDMIIDNRVDGLDVKETAHRILENALC